MKKFSPKGNVNREVVSRDQKFRMKKKSANWLIFFLLSDTRLSFPTLYVGGYNSYV